MRYLILFHPITSIWPRFYDLQMNRSAGPSKDATAERRSEKTKMNERKLVRTIFT